MTRKNTITLFVGAAVVLIGAVYFGVDQFKPEPVVPPLEEVIPTSLERPTDNDMSDQENVLTLTNSLSGKVIDLSLEAILKLPQITINTENEFVDSMTAFKGPLGRDILALAGEGGTTVVLTAVNDYAVEVPIEDFIKYDVVFAMSADGETFSRRDKGPIWVVYPMSDHTELQDPVYNARLIWQLVKVEVK